MDWVHGYDMQQVSLESRLSLYPCKISWVKNQSQNMTFIPIAITISIYLSIYIVHFLLLNINIQYNMAPQ